MQIWVIFRAHPILKVEFKSFAKYEIYAGDFTQVMEKGVGRPARHEVAREAREVSTPFVH